MTDITIFGQGNMGSAIGGLFEQAGNKVAYAKRGETLAQVGDIVVFATPFAAIDDLCRDYATQLAGKTVIDISNPVDFNTMDSLLVAADSSATAQIAAKLPNSRVVKAFNTNFAATLSSRKVGDAAVVVLVAGDSDEAKKQVADALQGSGVTVKDAGSLKRARELEAVGFLGIALAVREQIGWTGGFAVID